MLADMYYNGNGCEKNNELAAKWYEKAANKNNKRAQFRIAQMYENGEGVMQDCTKAFHWYCKCVEKSDPQCGQALCRPRTEAVGCRSDDKAVPR